MNKDRKELIIPDSFLSKRTPVEKHNDTKTQRHDVDLRYCIYRKLSANRQHVWEILVLRSNLKNMTR